MKLLHSLAIAAFLAGSTGIASAGTITLNSFGGANSTAPAGTDNLATVYTGTAATPPDTMTGAATYSIGTGGGTWVGPIGSSSWVSSNAGNCPGCGNIEPDGSYDYSTSFIVSGTVTSDTLSVLADDTTSVYLNGTLLVPSASSTQSTTGKCTEGQPNCTAVYTFSIPTADFIQGTNILSFGVQQDFQGATGLDFSGSISETPEPNTLVLLGTGAIALAGVLRKKIAA